MIKKSIFMALLLTLLSIKLLGISQNFLESETLVPNKTRLKPSFPSTFSDDELNYLEYKKEIKLCVTSGFMPFEDIDKNGKHIGFSSSYFEIFQDEMPIPFKVIATKNIEQSYQYLKNKKCDIISTINSSDKQSFSLLTHPYMVSPLVIAIPSPIPYISDFKNLKDKKLGVVPTVKYSQNLKQFFTTLNSTVEVSTVEEGLQSVAEGEIFGQIGTLAEIGYLFNKNFRGELKVAGKTDEVDLELSMAIRESDPMLFTIMQRLIKELDSSVHYDIVSQWTAIKYERGIDYQLAWRVLALFLFLALGGVVFLLILRAKNKKLHIAKEEIEHLNSSLEERVEQEVKKNREKDRHLFQQSRLAQMGELLSMISHQWRQPLSLINGTILVMQIDLMKKKYNVDEELFNYLDKNFDEINEYVQFLSNTMTDFTSFYSPNKMKELLNINSSIEDALSMISSMLKIKGTVVNLNHQTDKSLLLHKNEITQVILNILQNSQESFDKQEIVNPTIEIITKEKDGQIIIAISDNGGGIEDQLLEKIFDPYFSTKEERNGTGMGLYMSKMIIEEHNDGQLFVKNSEQGVCFNIIF